MNTQLKDRIDTCQYAVDQHPNDLELKNALGAALFEAEDYAASRASFEGVIALDPDNWTAHNAIGHVFYKLGMAHESIAAYERAIAIDPHKEQPYYGLAILRTNQLGDLDGAQEALKRGLAANPSSTWLRDTVATIHARAGNITLALNMLEEASRREAGNRFAREWCALLYMQQRRFDDCITACASDADIASWQDGQRTLGYAQIHLGHMAEAEVHLRGALELNSDDYEVAAALARLCYLRGLDAEAMQLEQRARGLAVQDGAYGHACIAAVMGDSDSAFASLATAFADDPALRTWSRLDPELTFIARDPRFTELFAPAGTD